MPFEDALSVNLLEDNLILGESVSADDILVHDNRIIQIRLKEKEERNINVFAINRNFYSVIFNIIIPLMIFCV